MTESEIKTVQNPKFWTSETEEAIYNDPDVDYFKKVEMVIDKIKVIVLDYHNSSDKDTYSLPYLIRERDKLTTGMFLLAGTLANIKKKYNISRFIRKTKFNRQKQELFDKEKMTDAKATVLATSKTEEELRKEMSLEAEAYQAELLLDTAKEVSNAMSSRLRMLESDIKISNKQV